MSKVDSRTMGFLINMMIYYNRQGVIHCFLDKIIFKDMVWLGIFGTRIMDPIFGKKKLKGSWITCRCRHPKHVFPARWNPITLQTEQIILNNVFVKT